MPQEITETVGGGVNASITVPIGTDPFNVPGDMAEMARDVFAAIRAKPVPQSSGATRNYYSGDELTNEIDFGYNDGNWQNLGIPACDLPTGYDFVVFMKAYLNISCSGLETDSFIGIRFWRTKAGIHDRTGIQFFPVSRNGDFRFAHTFYTTADRGGHAGVEFYRTPGWTVKAQSRYMYGFSVERHNTRTLMPDGVTEVVIDSQDPGWVEDPASGPDDDGLKFWIPDTYREVEHNGLVTTHVTDLAWLNQKVASVGTWANGHTVSEEYGTAWPAGKFGTAGDGTKVRFNGTQYEIVP